MSVPILVPIPAPDLTDTQKSAIVWLHRRKGSGILNQRCRLVAAGELAPAHSQTWLRLVTFRLVESAGPSRLQLTERGQTLAVELIARQGYGVDE